MGAEDLQRRERTIPINPFKRQHMRGARLSIACGSSPARCFSNPFFCTDGDALRKSPNVHTECTILSLLNSEGDNKFDVARDRGRLFGYVPRR